MNARFNIVGCAIAAQPAAAAIGECVEWVRRHGAEVLSHGPSETVFVRFDAEDGQLILFACRAAGLVGPSVLRFGFASGIKETAAAGAAPRLGDRGIMQACDLAGAAQPGQVLLSSQLGSLLQVAQIEPFERLRPLHVRLLDGRMASAYEVQPQYQAAGRDSTTGGRR